MNMSNTLTELIAERNAVAAKLKKGWSTMAIKYSLKRRNKRGQTRNCWRMANNNPAQGKAGRDKDVGLGFSESLRSGGAGRIRRDERRNFPPGSSGLT
jgi:hypothetical protein